MIRDPRIILGGGGGVGPLYISDPRTTYCTMSAKVLYHGVVGYCSWGRVVRAQPLQPCHGSRKCATLVISDCVGVDNMVHAWYAGESFAMECLAHFSELLPVFGLSQPVVRRAPAPGVLGSIPGRALCCGARRFRRRLIAYQYFAS